MPLNGATMCVRPWRELFYAGCPGTGVSSTGSLARFGIHDEASPQQFSRRAFNRLLRPVVGRLLALFQLDLRAKARPRQVALSWRSRLHRQSIWLATIRSWQRQFCIGTQEQPERRYTNSKKACDEALGIVVSRGDVSKLTGAESTEVIKLLRLALTEAQQVDPASLARVHQDFPIRYKDEYIKGLQVLIESLERNDKALTLAGTYGYNEFADWMARSKRDLKS